MTKAVKYGVGPIIVSDRKTYVSYDEARSLVICPIRRDVDLRGRVKSTPIDTLSALQPSDNHLTSLLTINHASNTGQQQQQLNNSQVDSF